MARRKIIIIKSRDISLDDLEALSFEYAYDYKRGDLQIPSLPDHYLAYMVLQAVRIPIEKRLKAIGVLNINRDFYSWILKCHGKEFKSSLALPDIDSLIIQRQERLNGEHLKQVLCDAVDTAYKRMGFNQTSLVKFPHIAGTQLASGVLDYFDPLKPDIDASSDFLNLLNRIRYERECLKKRIDPGPAPDTGTMQRDMMRSCAAAFRNALDRIGTLLQDKLPGQVSCAKAGNTLGLLKDRVGAIKNKMSAIEDAVDIYVREMDDERLETLISFVASLHDTLIHDHSFSKVFNGDEDVVFHMIDSMANKDIGTEIGRALYEEKKKNVYVMINAMSCEITFGLVLGRLFEVLDVPTRQIMYGGMALNAFIPKDEKDILAIFGKREQAEEIVTNARGIFGDLKPSMYFGFFDRPGARKFLDQVFDDGGKSPVVGYGIRAGQDGAWLDRIKAGRIVDNSKYSVSVFGMPLLRGSVRTLFVAGSCTHKCDFCASLGSMALSNQRTAQDVFEEIRWCNEDMLWLRQMFGKSIAGLKNAPLFRKLFDLVNRLVTGFAFSDDNFGIIHPWTLKLLDHYLSESDIPFICVTMMDVNTITKSEHRKFIRQWCYGSYLGLEVLGEDYIKDFKKAPAKIAIKLMEDKLVAIQEKKKQGTALQPAEENRLEYHGTLEKYGIHDRLQKAYLFQLSELVELGSIPMNFCILGVNGHKDMSRVALENVRFTQTPIKLFNLKPKTAAGRKLLQWCGNASIMAEQTMIFSIFAGSPDYAFSYPRRSPDGSLAAALQNLIIPGRREYDMVRMTSYLPQVNFNGFRALKELSGAQVVKQERCDPEDVALAFYNISKANTSIRNILVGAVGAAVVTYNTKDMYPFARRCMTAFKSSVNTAFFRFTGIYTARWMKTLLPLMRWNMYRRYVKVPVTSGEIDASKEALLQHYGFLVERSANGTFLRLAEKDLSQSNGFPKWVYSANRVDEKTYALRGVSAGGSAAGQYFSMVFDNIVRN